jgi:hypothetical protein
MSRAFSCFAALFDLVLGWLASERPQSLVWLPGDELEAARRASSTQ